MLNYNNGHSIKEIPCINDRVCRGLSCPFATTDEKKDALTCVAEILTKFKNEVENEFIVDEIEEMTNPIKEK